MALAFSLGEGSLTDAASTGKRLIAKNNDFNIASFIEMAHAFFMELTLPGPLADKLSSQDVALHLAIGLFVTEEATLAKAANVAGLSQTAFLRELGRRRIPIHYGPEELAADLQAVEVLAKR